MTIDTDGMSKFLAEMERLRGAYIMDISVACDMYAAALARAEAAITVSNSNARRAFNAEVENQRLTKEAAKARARAEAAEAERDDLRERHDNLKTAYANLVQEAADRLTRMYSAEAEERTRAAVAASLASAAAVARIGGRLGVDPSLPVEEFRETVIARVVELEAQLAAQQWRPVTEEWPHYAERVAIGHVAGNWAAIATRVQSPDDDEWELEDGKMLDWESASVAIELPPLPQEPPQ